MKVKDLLEKAGNDISIEFTDSAGDFICSTTRDSAGILPYMEEELRFWEVRQYQFEIETCRNADIHICLA